MGTQEAASILTEGNALLRRLFDIAARRLRDRGISMEYSESVIDWLQEQSDWRSSPNPQRTLDGCWHRKVASVLEELLLDGRLRGGNSVFVRLSESFPDRQIQFTISPSTDKGKSQGS